jgi:hypothetical protein
MDTFTIDEQTYRLMDTPEQAYDIAIGDNEAESKINIIAAINASGTEGTEYFYDTFAHPTVSAAAFGGDDAILTARLTGLAGNALVSTETFASSSNKFDDTTLGTETTAAADTLTIDTKVYTFQDVLTDVDGHVLIGTDVDASQVNLVAAVARSAGAGTLYAGETTPHPTVDLADFASDDAILTAKTEGLAGDSIATTETFDEGTNVFDATTLGDTTTGVDADTLTIDTTEYTFVTTAAVAGDVAVGADIAASKVNLVAAVADHATVSMADFIVNDAVLTAVVVGTAGNAIASTETFASGSNILDDTTLGTETLGVNGIKTELELLASITTVAVSGTAGDIDVTFPSAMGDVPMISIDDTNLSGGTTSGVAEDTEGVDATTTFVGVATHFDSHK